MRLRIAIVMAVLAAALLLPGLARADGGQGTGTDVVATVTGFSDGNGVPIPGSANGFADGNGAPTVGSDDGSSDGSDGAVTGATDGSAADGGAISANFGMSDGNG